MVLAVTEASALWLAFQESRKRHTLSRVIENCRRQIRSDLFAVNSFSRRAVGAKLSAISYPASSAMMEMDEHIIRMFCSFANGY